MSLPPEPQPPLPKIPPQQQLIKSLTLLQMVLIKLLMPPKQRLIRPLTLLLMALTKQLMPLKRQLIQPLLLLTK